MFDQTQYLKLALAEYALDVLNKNQQITALQQRIRKLEKENTQLNTDLAMRDFTNNQDNSDACHQAPPKKTAKRSTRTD
jgi:cell division protein FtsB